MDTPLVSVVISSYNRPAMLLASLQSVRQQTYPHLEIIIQDDSTNDDCEQALTHLLTHLQDPRIRYTHNRPPLGTAANLRAGYRKARGIYFSTLNDDDFYDPTYLETMVRPLEQNSHLALAFADHWVVIGDQVDKPETDVNTARCRRNLLHKGSVPDPITSAVQDKSVPGMFAVFRRSAIDLEDFPEEVSSGYDYWLSYLAVRDGAPIYYVPQRLTSYRVHGDSQTASFKSPQEALRAYLYKEFMLKRFLADPRLDRIHPELQRRLAQLRAGMGVVLLRLAQRQPAASTLLLSFRAHPRWKTALGLLLCLTPMPLTRKVLAR